MGSIKSSTGAIFLTIFLDLVGFGLVMPFLALQAREIFGSSEGTATMLSASYSLMQFVFVPIWGSLSDRIGRRPVLLVSIFFTMLSMVALGTSLAWGQTIAWLFIARMVGGAATANLGTASAYIADITSKEDRVKGMGMIGMAFGLGFIIGPGLGGLLSQFPINDRIGPVACFVAAGLSLINFLWAYKGLPESLPPEKRDRTQSRSMIPLNVKSAKKVISIPFIGRAIMVNFLIVLAFSGLEVTFAFYAKDAFSLTQNGVGALFVFMGVIAAGVQGGFMRRAGKKYEDSSLILVGLLMQAAAFLGFVISPSIGISSLLFFSALVAIGNGLTQPSISAFISRRTSDTKQGMALGTNHSFASLARVCGPAIGGFGYQFLGILAPFVMCAIIDAIGLIVGWKLKKSNQAHKIMEKVTA